MVHRVKNLTAVALVAAEAQVPFLDQHSGLNNMMLLQLRCRLQLWLRCIPLPRNFHLKEEKEESYSAI